MLRLVEAHPADPASARARFRLAELFDRSGDTDRAIHELQRLREMNPSSPLVPAALQRATLLLRLRKLAPEGRAWRPDGAFGEMAARGSEAGGTRAMAVASDGRIWVADEGSGEVRVFDPDGRLVSRTPVEGPVSLAIEPSGTVLVATQEAVTRGGGIVVAAGLMTPAHTEGGGEGWPPRIRRIGDVAALPGGEFLLLGLPRVAFLPRLTGESAPSLIRCLPDGRFDSIVRRFDGTAPRRIAVDGEGRIWAAFGGSDPAIELLAPDGAPIARILGGESGFASVGDIAVDAAGDLFLLEERGGTIHVLDRAGRPVTRIELAGSGLRKDEASALAVDATGRIYIGQRRSGRIVRLS